MRKGSLGIILAIVTIVTIGIAFYYSTTQTETAPTPTPSPTPTPEANPLEIEVNVTPWGDMYRKEPDCKEDFSVELAYPNQNANFTTNTFDIVINAGAYQWIVQKAFYTSDLLSGERWIPIEIWGQATIDLQKTFTFNLTNVPQGQHELTLTVIFHEGTRNQTTVFFNVLT